MRATALCLLVLSSSCTVAIGTAGGYVGYQAGDAEHHQMIGATIGVVVGAAVGYLIDRSLWKSVFGDGDMFGKAFN